MDNKIVSALQDDIQYIAYKMQEFEHEVAAKQGKGDIFVSLAFKSYDDWTIESYRTLLKGLYNRYTGALGYLNRITINTEKEENYET